MKGRIQNGTDEVEGIWIYTERGGQAEGEEHQHGPTRPQPITSLPFPLFAFFVPAPPDTKWRHISAAAPGTRSALDKWSHEPLCICYHQVPACSAWLSSCAVVVTGCCAPSPRGLHFSSLLEAAGGALPASVASKCRQQCIALGSNRHRAVFELCRGSAAQHPPISTHSGHPHHAGSLKNAIIHNAIMQWNSKSMIQHHPANPLHKP